MRKIIAGMLVLASGLGGELLAQSECTQNLRTARLTYDQGRLHELPGLLRACLRNGFTQSEKVEAYKLLIQTYIYLEEPDSADLQMINLLGTDHFFQINEAIDPVEFKSLYKKFRSDPVFRYGLKVGGNYSHFTVLENHFMWGPSEGKGEYLSQPGIQFGLLFEKDLKYLRNKLALNPELFYTSYSFSYNNQSPVTQDQSDVGELDHSILQSTVQANVMFQYRIEEEITLADNFTPYVAIGPSVSYLLTSDFDGTTNVGSEITGSAFDIRSRFKTVNFSVIASAGIKMRLGDVYLTADVRYQRGLFNVANEDTRWKNDDVTRQLWSYGYVNNDFRISQSMINVGIIIPRFHPVKLIR